MTYIFFINLNLTRKECSQNIFPCTNFTYLQFYWQFLTIMLIHWWVKTKAEIRKKGNQSNFNLVQAPNIVIPFKK